METKMSDLELLLKQQNSLLDAIASHLDKSSWPEALLIGVVVALAGALGAYFFTLMHWRKLEAEGAKTALLRQLHDLVADFEKVCLEYWLKDSNENDVELSIRIKTTHRMILRYARLFKDLKTAPETYRLRFLDFSSQIYDDATGDGFESKGRKLSRSKASTIARRCTDARALLNELAYKKAFF